MAGARVIYPLQQPHPRLLEYSDLGIDTFILSGYPRLEESYRAAELLFPLLPLTHSESSARENNRARSRAKEIVGNEFRTIK